MSIENGPENMLRKRQLISLIKEHDDLIAEKSIAEGDEEQTQFLNQRINNQKERLDAERMNYTDEQWNLLVQIANHESGYGAYAESRMFGNQNEDYKKERQQQIDENKQNLQKRWQNIFGDEPFDW